MNPKFLHAANPGPMTGDGNWTYLIGDRHPVLIDAGLTKEGCYQMIRDAGIELPRVYAQGYPNANCIGCVKGGMGYWNKVRRDFPAEFEELAAVQEAIGEGANLFRDRHSDERFSLRELPPDAGRHDEPLPACSFFCEIAEQEYTA